MDRLEGQSCGNCKHFEAPVTCTRRWRIAQNYNTKTRHDLWCEHYERTETLSDAIEDAKQMNVFKDEPEVAMLTPEHPSPFTEFINEPPKVYDEPAPQKGPLEPGKYDPEDAGPVLLELNILKSDLERQMMAIQGSLASTQAFHKSVVMRIEAVTKMQHP